MRIQLQPTAVPPFQSAPECWSAFVTPDLAALFDETPWLDLPPGADAQAELLSRLQPIGARELQRALQRLQPPAEAASSALHAATNDDDPRRFLLRVMNDAGVEMRLRIEAAKALLLAAEGSPR